MTRTNHCVTRTCVLQSVSRVPDQVAYDLRVPQQKNSTVARRQLRDLFDTIAIVSWNPVSWILLRCSWDHYTENFRSAVLSSTLVDVQVPAAVRDKRDLLALRGPTRIVLSRFVGSRPPQV